jgi:sulfur carrier protein
MQIKVNNQNYRIEETQISIEDLLRQLEKAATTGIAVAVNDEVIAKNEWKHYLLKEQDDLLIVTATQGG